jgi:hypothetical protein
VKRDTGEQVPAVGPVDRLADAETRRVGAHQVVRALGLMFEEQRLLAKRDVVWRLYDAYEL